MSHANTRYSPVTQAIHWLSAILVLSAFALGLGGPEDSVYQMDRDFERALHETLGMAVFTLTLIRLLWKLVDRKPDPLPLARWMHLASKAAQGALYLLLLAVPVTAILGAWLEGHPVALLGGIHFEAPVAPAHALGVTVSEIHTWLGDLIIWIAGLHAAAAIYHHLVLKDRVLLSMVPSWLLKSR